MTEAKHSPHKAANADSPAKKARRMSGWVIGSLVLIPAALAGALYLDSLPGKPYTPPPPLAPVRQVADSVPPALLKALENRITALEHRVDELSVPATIVTETSPDVEQELQSLHSEIETLKIIAAPSDAPSPEALPKDSLLVALYKLEKAALSGEPFTDRLDALLENPTLPDALHQKLQLLKKPAARGIATNRMLSDLFDESMEAYQNGVVLAPEEGSSTWAQVKQNLASLITIRKVGDVNGTGDEAALARAGEAVAEDDITAALGEISQLGEDTIPYFEDWLKHARRHQKTLQTIERARELLENAPAPDSAPPSPGNV